VRSDFSRDIHGSNSLIFSIVITNRALQHLSVSYLSSSASADVGRSDFNDVSYLSTSADVGRYYRSDQISEVGDEDSRQK
jgi:hypothetical protein